MKSSRSCVRATFTIIMRYRIGFCPMCVARVEWNIRFTKKKRNKDQNEKRGKPKRGESFTKD